MFINEQNKIIKNIFETYRKKTFQILKKYSPYTPVEVELFMVKGPSMLPEGRSSSDPR